MSYKSSMKEKKHIRKSHNVTLLLYHIVLPAKYRKKVFTDAVYRTLIKVCLWIEKRYEIYFLEIWNDEDHVHFMIQWIPNMSVTEIVSTLKSITTNKIREKHKEEINKKLWWWKLRTSWYYANTVWAFAWEQTIRNYIKNQWIDKYKVRYEKCIQDGQLPLWLEL